MRELISKLHMPRLSAVACKAVVPVSEDHVFFAYLKPSKTNRSLAQVIEAQGSFYQTDDQKTNYSSCSKYNRIANNRLYSATNVLRVALPLRLSMWKSPIGRRAVTTVRRACTNNRIVL